MTDDDQDALSEELAALFEELHRRSAIVTDLEPAQVEGFVSGLFAALDDQSELPAFVRYCRERPGAVSAVLCAGLAVLADDPTAGAARRAFDAMAADAPPVSGRLGRARAVAAWSAQAPFGRSIVIGCGPAPDRIDHAVLAELDGELLSDLQLSGEVAELVDPESIGDPAVEILDLDVTAAAELVGRAWRNAHGRVEPTAGMLANQRLARLRLASAVDDDELLPLFAAAAVSVDVTRGMSPEEIADANAAARSTLRAAVGAPATDEVEHAWVEVVRATAPVVSQREREALLWLEWADWLGAGIGLLRRRDGGVRLDGTVLVDLVNTCPEVSSSIHGDDRDYAAWAFDVALDHLADAGLVVDGMLTERGRSTLHPSLLAAWGGS